MQIRAAMAKRLMEGILKNTNIKFLKYQSYENKSFEN
jgi:hypothetical protein